MAKRVGGSRGDSGSPYSLPVDDAELARRAATGDRAAWADIYDRYADRLHDYCHSILRDRHESADALHEAFLTASTKIGQLRDPERLRPWLYAICRTQALAMVRHRSRETPTEFVSDVADMTPQGVSGAEQSDYQVQELRRLVWDAAGGLAPRDRSVLDLHLRHGLEGQELGEVLGVNPHHATVLLARVREHVERSLGALLVGRAGRRDCRELGGLLADWDGSLTPVLRKRIARHIDHCARCGERRRRMVSPLALLSGVPMLPAPPELREPVLDGVVLRSSNQALGRYSDHEPPGTDPGFGMAAGAVGTAVAGAGYGPEPVTERSSGRQWPVAAAGALLALLLIGGLVFAIARPERPLAGAPAVSQSPSVAVSSVMSTGTPTSSTASSSTTSAEPPETTTSASPAVRTPTTTAASSPPVITSVSADARRISFSNSECQTSSVTARVTDEGSVDVVLVWQTSTGDSTQQAMSSRPGNRYEGTIGPVQSPSEGPIQWWVVATDGLGDQTRSSTQTLQVAGAC